MRDFRKLEIWSEAIMMTKAVYDLTSLFPVHEKYGLCSQMNRAAVSIPSNIAEGCSRRTNLEFSRFLEIALGSSFELETQIEISKRVLYISQESYETVLNELHTLQKRVNAYKEKLKE